MFRRRQNELLTDTITLKLFGNLEYYNVNIKEPIYV